MLQIVVTSDDEEILAIARQYEADGVIAYKRPDELATDSAATIDVIKDVCSFVSSGGFNPETIILLQPTSPLRNAEDIQGALGLYCRKKTKDTVVSVCEVEHPSAWTGTLTDDGVITGIDFSGKRSQEYTKEYRLNGAVYVADYYNLISAGSVFSSNVYAYDMPRRRSVDIDDELDFNNAAYIFGLIF